MKLFANSGPERLSDMKLSTLPAAACFFVAGLLAADSSRGEVRLEFDNLPFRSGKSFTFAVPGDLKDVYYSYAGRNGASMNVTACRVAKDLNDNAKGMLTAPLGGSKKYPAKLRSFTRDQRPDLQNCQWGVYVACFDQSGCSGEITIWWDRWDGTSSRGTGPAGANTPYASGHSSTGDPAGRSSPDGAGKTNPPPAGAGADIGDAGTNNNDAALIGYGCRVDGHLRQGDYDNFTFFFPGGALRAWSSGGLNLVADLLDSKGQKLARSGVDTPQFDIQGNFPAGKYFLQVRVMHHAGAGSYRIHLGPDSGCKVTERP
jgi:hypothetical protein